MAKQTFSRRVAAPFAAVLLLAALTAFSNTVQAQPQTGNDGPAVLFVVDTSGSMSGSRITQAKAALTSSIDALAVGQAAGLRSFAGSCGDGGDLRAPVGAGNRDTLRTVVAGLRTGGGTPTPDALRAAESDVSGISGPRSIVLISDGQSGCGDPCPVAADIAGRLGIEFKVYTVGFQTSGTAENELSCIADATGGEYFPVDDAESLADAISDVVGSNADRDGDGLLNIWETDGVDIDGDGTIDVDLPALGADPDVPDVFIEVDWMSEPGGICFLRWCSFRTSYRPTNAQMEVVYAAFRGAPYDIQIHIDSGPESRNFDGTRWGDASGGNRFPYVETLITDSILYDGYIDDRAENLTLGRDEVFYHAIFADVLSNGKYEIGGRASSIPGNAFVVSQGQPSATSNTVIGGTFLHEFGHTAGLRHGGDDNTNQKPNYVSSMNYFFQNLGIPGGPQADFSRVKHPDLNEASLDENAGVSYPTRFLCGTNEIPAQAGPVDWNCDIAIGTQVRANVNNDTTDNGAEIIEVLTGYDDWSNLQIGEGISDYAAFGFKPNNSPEELPLDEIPFNTDDALQISGLRDLTVAVGDPLPELRYEILNTGDDSDTFSVEVGGTAANATAVTVGPLAAGETAMVPVQVVSAGLVELLVTSGNDTSVAGSTDTLVVITDVSEIDPLETLETVAKHLLEMSTEPGVKNGARKKLTKAAAGLRDAAETLGGDRATWDAKRATLSIHQAARHMKPNTRVSDVDAGLEVLLGVLADVSGRIADDAIGYAESSGAKRSKTAKARKELVAGEAYNADGNWYAAVNAYKRAAGSAFAAYRT